MKIKNGKCLDVDSMVKNPLKIADYLDKYFLTAVDKSLKLNPWYFCLQRKKYENPNELKGRLPVTDNEMRNILGSL